MSEVNEAGQVQPKCDFPLVLFREHSIWTVTRNLPLPENQRILVKPNMIQPNITNDFDRGGTQLLIAWGFWASSITTGSSEGQGDTKNHDANYPRVDTWNTLQPHALKKANSNRDPKPKDKKLSYVQKYEWIHIYLSIYRSIYQPIYLYILLILSYLFILSIPILSYPILSIYPI